MSKSVESFYNFEHYDSMNYIALNMRTKSKPKRNVST